MTNATPRDPIEAGGAIRTLRLVVRPWTPEPDDVESLHGVLSDPVTMSFWPAPFEPADTQHWIARALESHEASGFGRCALLLAQTHEVIGDVGIQRATVDGREENDLGWILHHPYWGNGYATEAAAACLDHGHGVLGLSRIVANMAHDHERSRRVAERIGMTLAGEFDNPRNRGIRTLLYVSESVKKPLRGLFTDFD